MSNNWHEIWEKRTADEKELQAQDPEKIFLELKRIAGWDSIGENLTYEQFYNQYIKTRNELEFCAQSRYKPMNSIYEVGCGCGANLFLFQQHDIKIGGIDYSSSEIDIAKKILHEPVELTCAEAINIPVDIKYDAVLSNSVFSYFTDYDYAQKVLESMYQKTNYSIGIIDIHDIHKKEEFIKYRKSVIENYEIRYENLPKLFYDPSFVS